METNDKKIEYMRRIAEIEKTLSWVHVALSNDGETWNYYKFAGFISTQLIRLLRTEDFIFCCIGVNRELPVLTSMK